jgi:hypothetical protein
VASAVRRRAVLVRLVADARTPARRRRAQTATGTRMAGAVHRHRSVRRLGGGPRRRLRRRLNARGLNAVEMRTGGCAWPSVDGGGGRASARAIRALSDPAWARRPLRHASDGRCACTSPRIGPPASTSATPATSAKQARSPIPSDGHTVTAAAMPDSGEIRALSLPTGEPCVRGHTGIPARPLCLRRATVFALSATSSQPFHSGSLNNNPSAVPRLSQCLEQWAVALCRSRSPFMSGRENRRRTGSHSGTRKTRLCGPGSARI